MTRLGFEHELGRGLPAAVLLLTLAAHGCGGGGGGGAATPVSPTPTTPASLPAGGVCGILNGATGVSESIVNGTGCAVTATTPVVLLNLRDEGGRALGGCSGTVIGRRAVLTAAHCLHSGVGSVIVEQGGVLVRAASLHPIPAYRENDLSSIDVGVVLTGEDLSGPVVPLLQSRDARIGEQAVIAGWGKDQYDISGTLRAAATTIATVGAYFLETRVDATGSGVCSGDSGGPLLLAEGGGWALAGVTSASSTGGSCISGINYFTNLRHADAAAFVQGLVPDAVRR